MIRSVGLHVLKPSTISSRRSARLTGWLALVWPMVVAACDTARFAAPTPVPSPTVPLTVLPLSTDTPIPTPASTETPSLEVVLPTLIALLPRTATPLPTQAPAGVFDPGNLSVAEPGCAITLTAPVDTYRLVPDPAAPEAARAAWTGQITHSLEAEVVAHDGDLKTYALRAVAPPADHGFLLAYGGDPLPIEIGRAYRFVDHTDVPGAPPAGTGLRIDDDAGPRFLGVGVRETEGADRRVLAGDRAGFIIRQLPTRCRYVQLDACGYELRAAPVEVARGEGRAVVDAGETATLAGDPPYRARVQRSHYRRWAGDVPCADPTDWVLAYRIERVAEP